MTMRTRIVWLPALIIMLSPVGAMPQTFADDQAIIQFQRAADSYAFSHRQTERRGAAPAGMVEGALFTPQASAALRSRIRAARTAGCAVPGDGVNSAVPRVNQSASDTAAVPPCIAAALPHLPDELEYRMSGVALLLADAHLHVVVDVLHGAFPGVDN